MQLFYSTTVISLRDYTGRSAGKPILTRVFNGYFLWVDDDWIAGNPGNCVSNWICGGRCPFLAIFDVLFSTWIVFSSEVLIF